MADIEVENILREIRERVYAEQEASSPAVTSENGSNTSRENGEMGPDELARLESYLTTTARAWDRLPPLVSNRSGTRARFELWLKRHFKRATRWYAWEQINFNAAVHHALRDMLQLLSANQKTIENLRAQRSELNTQRAKIEAQQRLIAEQCLATDARVVVVDGRLADIINQLREVTSEQRVLYKQLALETSEAAVLEDRARRKTEVLLEQLQRRVEKLEKL